ncbi:NAD(P)H-binding protein [Desulfovibrio sp. OttesenSCG-928-A18]|nr:NAD(P)H-binding protein [Desulfovibrio sp. OttesenSCG-928-A18]
MSAQNSPSAAGQKAHAVTGAFGFTGKYLARRLLDQGERVITLTNSPDRPNPFGGQIEARPFQFDRPEALAASLADVSVLYNTYWVRFNHSRFTHSEAVRNTLILFEAAKKAGVERVVHVSISNADRLSPLEYFSAKGHLEKALEDFGLCHAIVRPAVLFGDEGILINNIAWALRRFPVFCLFGDGNYHICPIFVDDLAAIMQEQGKGRRNSRIDAFGPEDFSYRDLILAVAAAIGVKRRLLPLAPKAAHAAAWLIGKAVGDTFVTHEEIQGLMADTLHIPGKTGPGTTDLRSWMKERGDSLGRVYQSELDRRIRRDLPY